MALNSYNRGFTHVFSCINICQVPRKLFEHGCLEKSVKVCSIAKIMSLTEGEGRGGHIVFGAGPIGVKVTAVLKLPNLSQKVLVCTISHELVGRFQPDLHGYNIVT